MNILPTQAAMLLAAFIPFGKAEAQSFSRSSDTSGSVTQSTGTETWFALAEPARKVSFSFLPPAEKMFVDPTGTVAHFPALFPPTVHFHELGTVPDFFVGRFKGAFSAWKIGDLYLALAEGYTLYSATFRDGQLFVLAKDADGDFVQLDKTHFALAHTNGTPLKAEASPRSAALISILVDRSGSMQGFDADMAAALDVLSGSLGGAGTCALYEFGTHVKAVRSAERAEPCQELFSDYRMSSPVGGTSLFAAMDRAYLDLETQDALTVVVVLSDGAPTDGPTHSTAKHAESIPTLVLWVGDHTTNHIARYSTAHAISKSGAQNDITAFLATSIATANAHQVFNVKGK